jgi:hypothetical protein
MKKRNRFPHAGVTRLLVPVLFALLVSSQAPAPGIYVGLPAGGYFVAVAGGVVEPAPAPVQVSPNQAFIYYD